MRRWGGAGLVEAGMGPPRPSGRGTRMFSLSILRRWTPAPSGGLARGASRGVWLLPPSVRATSLWCHLPLVPPYISHPSQCGFTTGDGVKREGERGCVVPAGGHLTGRRHCSGTWCCKVTALQGARCCKGTQLCTPELLHGAEMETDGAASESPQLVRKAEKEKQK